MYVSGIRVHGLRDADDFALEGLGRVVELPPGPAGVAVVDSLGLFTAALRVERVVPLLAELELADPDDIEIWDEEGFPVQAAWPDGSGVGPLLAPNTRQVTVALDLALDPPLFGRLRELSVREPRLVAALSEDQITVKVGWLWSKDLTAVTPSVLGVSVGSVGFAAQGAERPAWLSELLLDLGDRLGKVDPSADPLDIADDLLEASLSADPDARRAHQRVAEVLAGAPFGLGTLELVRSGGTVRAAFGSELRALRQLGPGAARSLRLVHAALVMAPDILVVADELSEDVRAWLGRCTEGDEATLEQVWLASEGPA